MERRRAEQQVGHEIEGIDPAAADVRPLERLERVDLVGDQQEHEIGAEQPERDGPGTRRRQQAHRHADEEQVRERVGEADGEAERVEIGRHDLRLDQERPGEDRDGRREDRGVDESAAVATGEPTADQLQQAQGDEWVAGEVQDVGDRRERVLTDDLEPVPHEIAGHEQGLPECHEEPWSDALRPVAPDAEKDHADRRRADRVVQEALGQ